MILPVTYRKTNSLQLQFIHILLSDIKVTSSIIITNYFFTKAECNTGHLFGSKN